MKSTADLGKTFSFQKEKWVIRYEELTVSGVIGSGSFGTVHAGIFMGKKVAVKFFLKQKVNDNAILEMRTESAMLSELDHPNVIKFYGSCVKMPHLCIVNEMMERGSLSALLYDPAIALPWERRLAFAKNIADGMEYLHKHNIIHRDIKSPNMLVGQNWNVKIGDFGFSRMKADNQTMTQCGTVAWTAPEIFEGTHYNEKADVFAFAVILWELVSRKRPWEGMHSMKIIQAVTSGSRLPMNLLPSDAPSVLVDLMRACWDKDPNLRPSFEDIVTQLSVY